MNEHLEDALDSYLGDKTLDDSHVIVPQTNAGKIESINQESRPESKIWGLIDKWKKQGLSPKFEICAKMLKLWDVDT